MTVEPMDAALVEALLARAGIALEAEERERLVAASGFLADAVRRVRAVEDPALEGATTFVPGDGR